MLSTKKMYILSATRGRLYTPLACTLYWILPEIAKREKRKEIGLESGSVEMENFMCFF